MAKFNIQVTESIKAIDAEKEAQEAKEQEAREQAAIRSILFTAEQEAQRIKREAEAKAQRMRNEIAACKAGISYAEYQNRISRSMGYGYGSYCGCLLYTSFVSKRQKPVNTGFCLFETTSLAFHQFFALKK